MGSFAPARRAGRRRRRSAASRGVGPRPRRAPDLHGRDGGDRRDPQLRASASADDRRGTPPSTASRSPAMIEQSARDQPLPRLVRHPFHERPRRAERRAVQRHGAGERGEGWWFCTGVPAADRSYGPGAKLAGLPGAVIERAKLVLAGSRPDRAPRGALRTCRQPPRRGRRRPPAGRGARSRVAALSALHPDDARRATRSRRLRKAKAEGLRVESGCARLISFSAIPAGSGKPVLTGGRAGSRFRKRRAGWRWPGHDQPEKFSV